jgi:hypothetical protein
MMIQNAGYDPELIDWTEIDEAMRKDIAEQLVEFHQLFRDCFLRPQQRLLGLGYLRGLLSDIQRKNIEAIALAFGGETKVRCCRLTSRTGCHRIPQSKSLKGVRRNICRRREKAHDRADGLPLSHY